MLLHPLKYKTDPFSALVDLEDIKKNAESASCVVRKILVAYLQTKKNDLDERWKVFIEYQRFLPVDGCIIELACDGQKVKFYDKEISGIVYERFQEIDMMDLFNHLVLETIKFYDTDLDDIKAVVDILREDILQLSISSFIMDW